MTKKYSAKVGLTFWFSVAIVVVCISAAVWFMTNTAMSFRWSILAFIFPLTLMTWVYLDTCYKIKGDTLVYRSGFIRGRIPIGSIRKIKTRATMWTGTKPALASRGMILTYGRYAKVFIAPEDEQALLDDLKTLNPGIEVE